MILEDRLLLWKLQRGDADALRQVYEEYRHDLLGLAVTLCRDKAMAEDAVHDAFVAFVRFTPRLRLRTSLRSYLLSAVANRVRSLNQAGARPVVPATGAAEEPPPEQTVLHTERARLIDQALVQLPDEQREAVILHLQVGMRFREIANSQKVSINTVQSRYRYGLEKLRSLLNGQVMP
ncbi:MAG: sigma-70 family RNA polymerase sigma factor [Planctomycetes bacterium]|nr:sigma-70 family RNA polymerase sigma factor [Planctomycetota bacterium]